MAVLRRVCDEQPRPIREVNPEVPDWLEAIVGRLHAKDPADRFGRPPRWPSCCGRCLAHLERPLSTSRSTGLDRAKAKPAPSAPRRRRAIAASATAAGSGGRVVLAGAWGAWRGPRDCALHGGARPDAGSVAAAADGAAADGGDEQLFSRVRQAL